MAGARAFVVGEYVLICEIDVELFQRPQLLDEQIDLRDRGGGLINIKVVWAPGEVVDIVVTIRRVVVISEVEAYPSPAALVCGQDVYDFVGDRHVVFPLEAYEARQGQVP